MEQLLKHFNGAVLVDSRLILTMTCHCRLLLTRFVWENCLSFELYLAGISKINPAQPNIALGCNICDLGYTSAAIKPLPFRQSTSLSTNLPRFVLSLLWLFFLSVFLSLLRFLFAATDEALLHLATCRRYIFIVDGGVSDRRPDHLLGTGL